MNILFISSDFPDGISNGGAFVQQLVYRLATLGHNCYVISPSSFVNKKRLVKSRHSFSLGKGFVTVETPNVFSFSTIKLLGFNLSSIFRRKAIYKILNKMTFKPDVVYGHFWRCGLEIYEYAERNKLPLFIASGESSIPSFNSTNLKAFCDYVSGVICVSTKNMRESIELGLTTEDKCMIIPNGVNTEVFHMMNKFDCRKQLGISGDLFVTATLGWFSERKGQKRVAEAIDRLRETDIKSIFMGDGPAQPQSVNILFKGEVSHDDIPVYLNAADVYVLPTRAEGCCNSIVEAMACGLPIISSDRLFNYDICDSTNSILIDPDNIEQIGEAILKIKKNAELRAKLSEGALEKVKSLSLDERAKKIVNFIELKTHKNDISK